VIEVPRANANEDQLQVIAVHVCANQMVEAGELMFVLETTKVAVEVLSPKAGIVCDIRASVGDFVEVGSLLCRVVPPNHVEAGSPDDRPLDTPGEIIITSKARKIAGDLGIDLAQVKPVNGRIGEAEVRAARPMSATADRPITGWRESHPATRRAIIIGGGGHGACLIAALRGAGYDLLGCIDRAKPVGTQVLDGLAVVGDETTLAGHFADGVRHAFVGIGGAENSQLRRLMFERLLAIGFDIPPIIHPAANLAPDVRVGRGCHILAGATIGPGCLIGENVIINQGSIVCHDSVIHDHAHIAPGAVLAGNVTVGPRSVVGMASTVLLGTSIGADCLLHNGSHIVADVSDGMIVDAQGRRTVRNIAGAQRPT
jgi:sugar O-acyltransferase (sialic acid O-acetyltransferase NeuD family)